MQKNDERVVFSILVSEDTSHWKEAKFRLSPLFNHLKTTDDFGVG
jgi:hypothetical protein